MKTRHVHTFFALVTVTSLALTGTVSSTGSKSLRHDIRQESRGRAALSDQMEFLTRYYYAGASAGSTWESLVDEN